ncbi:hypothetical protein R3I93_002492 [Phoxinus phoxinus]|uniref:Uncharacterized protein n=1 Tax=Phoxinus phoxinus TaxID=58324 RepID=A0AAN9HK34_9TELE
MSDTAPAGASVPVNVQRVLRDSSQLEVLLKSQTKALGTVQLMIGLLTLLFGIVSTVWNGNSGAVLSGVYYWGSLTYIIAGSLCIAAENELISTSRVCLIRGSYGMNVASAVTAAIAMIIILVDLAIWTDNCSKGIAGVLFVFTLLEFVVSICLSASTCKANGCCTPQIFVISNSSMPQQPADIPPQRRDIKVNEVVV